VKTTYCMVSKKHQHVLLECLTVLFIRLSFESLKGPHPLNRTKWFQKLKTKNLAYPYPWGTSKPTMVDSFPQFSAVHRFCDLQVAIGLLLDWWQKLASNSYYVRTASGDLFSLLIEKRKTYSHY
jgi:hypothetical protein